VKHGHFWIANFIYKLIKKICQNCFHFYLVPQDDGLANHLVGMSVPDLDLKSTKGENVNLSKIQGLFVIYCYPMTGKPGVNFINVLRAAFTLSDPKSVKTYWWLNWTVTLLGSACIKAAHRMLMKLTPGVNFTNILQSAFLDAAFLYFQFGLV